MNPHREDDSPPLDQNGLPIGYPSQRRNAISGPSLRDPGRVEMRAVLSEMYGFAPQLSPNTSLSDYQRDCVPPSGVLIRPQWTEDFAFVPRSGPVHHDAEGSGNLEDGDHSSPTQGLNSPDDVEIYDQAADDQEEITVYSDFDSDAIDDEIMEEIALRVESEESDEEQEEDEKEEEEQEQEPSRNESSRSFWQDSTLAWARDSLVQVRVDSDFPDYVATEQALAYRVVVSLGEGDVGISILELAFRADKEKAPYRTWRYWEDLQPYTDDALVMDEYEERRARNLSRRREMLAVERVNDE